MHRVNYKLNLNTVNLYLLSNVPEIEIRLLMKGSQRQVAKYYLDKNTILVISLQFFNNFYKLLTFLPVKL
jgi:hypothetical protein